MSHYLEAKKMLNDAYVGNFLRKLLNEVFKDGYTFQDPQYPNEGAAVEIFIKKLTSEKSLFFDAAMRVMKIEISYPCGVTRQINGKFRTEIRELKDILVKASNIKPDEDKNYSVLD